MKDILSYISNKKIKGSEIKEWIKFNIDNQTEYMEEAKEIIKYFNISDDNYYFISKWNNGEWILYE